LVVVVGATVVVAVPAVVVDAWLVVVAKGSMNNALVQFFRAAASASQAIKAN
jgi:hypothetical protein